MIGCQQIPASWLAILARRSDIEELCNRLFNLKQPLNAEHWS